MRAILPRGFMVTCMLLAGAAAHAVPSAEEVMSNNFQATKISGFSGEVTLTLINERDEKRVRKMQVRSKLRDNGVDSAVLTRFAQPADIKGTGFLQLENNKADDDIWVYLPGLGKTRRLAANNKRDSFFGTDFSYGDILLPAVDKYRHTLLRQEALDGKNCYVIESVPLESKTRDDTGYSRKVSWVDAANYVERKVEYYGLDDALLKTQLTFDIQAVEPDRQRWLPMRREMTNHQTGHQTLYQFDRFAVSKELTEREFSTRKLEEG
jgi:hypothetical protein